MSTLLEKNPQKLHPVEKLYYRMVRCYVLDKSSKRAEALAELEQVLSELTTQKINDSQLLE